MEGREVLAGTTLHAAVKDEKFNLVLMIAGLDREIKRIATRKAINVLKAYIT